VLFVDCDIIINMQISEKHLRRIIRKKLLSEQVDPDVDADDNGDSESLHPMAYATVLAGRWSAHVPKWMNLKGLGPSPHHSWIILYDGDGEVSKWFSGKTDKEDLPGAKSLAGRVAFGRHDLAALIAACENPSHRNAEMTMWGALEGLENAEFDNPATAELKWLVTVPGVSSRELQRRIESAHEMYDGSSPYEFNPAWQMSHLGASPEDSRCGRNSNSYSHSLLRYAGIRRGSFQPLDGTQPYHPRHFPGARYQIRGVPKN